MDDISILRRTIMWELLNVEFPKIRSDCDNQWDVKLALQACYGKFVFVSEEVEDRDEVRLQAERLLEDMFRPAVMKVECGWSTSPDEVVESALKEARGLHPIDAPQQSPQRAPR